MEDNTITIDKKELARQILSRVNEILAADTTKPKAKALLLLSLCNIYSIVNPSIAKEYYERLKLFAHLLSGEQLTQYSELREVFDPHQPSPQSFAGQQISMLEATLNRPGVSEDEVKAALRAVEQQLLKRHWPFGKKPIWEAIINYWSQIDRNHALELCIHLSGASCSLYVSRMNRQNPLTPDAWNVLLRTLSQNQVAQIALKILSDSPSRLDIPADFILPVMKQIRSRLVSVKDVSTVLDLASALAGYVATPDRLPQLFNALTYLTKELCTFWPFNQQWIDLFHAVFRLIGIGVSSKALTIQNMKALYEVLPGHLHDFAHASFRGWVATEETAEQMLIQLMDAKNRIDSEAWFLVTLVKRGMGNLAYSIARKPNYTRHLTRVCRAWLCTDNVEASAVISDNEVPKDAMSQILVRKPGAERVAYLREITKWGKVCLGSDVWADLRGSTWVDDLIGKEKQGVTAADTSIRSPLFSGLYNKETAKDQQFSEFLRVNGYGEYNHELVDVVLLGTLVLWANDYPDEVKNLLKLMWNAIEPTDTHLMIEHLRASILTRSATVFSADPQIFKDTFINWLKKRLVDQSLSWQSGNTQYSLHFPESMLVNFYVQGAAAIQSISPDRSDQLLQIALTCYNTEPPMAELAAQLYNSDKELLDLKLTWRTKSDIEEPWQIGIVKHALSTIFQVVIISQTASE